ncbi:Ankyrin repeat-containing protein [Artemisia annua]|uniref:Ankyrin repeat-containing protein n=1 Tax=Artemisia annua TaxID=35608 RepID=A0A2U1MGK0_ARTAN|nr:Ankyrin repeat-containing protein [Artemisia annua]
MNRWLMQAAWNGDVDHLLKEIDINPHMLHAVALEGSETPLHIACFAGHLTFAATVIKLRQEFCMELNQDGFSPLHIAAACGHVDIVKELLKVDLGLCLIKGKDRKIPRHLAVVKGKIDVVRELLPSSLNSVECKTAQGETSLHLAVKHNQFEALQILIQHLKQVNKEDLLNCKDFYGNTILHLAVARKQYEVVDFLLNAEVTINESMELNSLNKSMLTPLDILLMFQSEAGDREIEEILVQAGALKAENLQSPAHTQEQTAYHPDTRHENPPSPAKKLIDYFKYNNLQDSPNKVRNTLLVVIILITAATYQPALSPPGGTWQDDFTPPEGNNTLYGTNTTNTPKKHTAGQAIMGTHNPVAYTIFLFSNSLGFYMSLHMITILTTAFPLRLEFQLLMFSLAATYALCMNAIAPKPFITYAFIGISIAFPFMIPAMTTLYRNYWQRRICVLRRTSQDNV